MNVTASLRMVACTATLGLLASCAGMGASMAPPGVLEPGKFTPAAPTTTTYGPDATRSCPGGGAYATLQALIKKEMADKPTLLTPDGRLCTVAATLLGWDTSRGAVPDNVLSTLLWSYGMVESRPHQMLSPVETKESKMVARALADVIKDSASQMHSPRYGVAIARPREDKTMVALLLVETDLTLAPVPRTLAVGAKTTISGKLSYYDSAEIIVSDIAGAVTKTDAAKDAQFSVEAACGDKPGRLQVEIRGVEGGASSTVANFPIYCGTTPPVAAKVFDAPALPLDVAKAEKLTLELTNKEREAAGLSPLVWDENVSAVARAAAETMREQLVSTGSASPEGIGERLKQAGVLTPVVLQMPAFARSIEEAHEGFIMSPARRGDMLSTEVNHGGVGVAVVERPNEPVVIIVDQVLVNQLPPLDVGATRTLLRDAIAKKRADAKATVLTSDEPLENAAQQYADAMAAAGGKIAQETADKILEPFYQGLRHIEVLVGPALEPLEAANERKVLSEGNALGVGVATGTDPILGKNTPYVVILIGTRDTGDVKKDAKKDKKGRR